MWALSPVTSVLRGKGKAPCDHGGRGGGDEAACARHRGRPGAPERGETGRRPAREPPGDRGVAGTFALDSGKRSDSRDVNLQFAATCHSETPGSKRTQSGRESRSPPSCRVAVGEDTCVTHSRLRKAGGGQSRGGGELLREVVLTRKSVVTGGRGINQNRWQVGLVAVWTPKSPSGQGTAQRGEDVPGAVRGAAAAGEQTGPVGGRWRLRLAWAHGTGALRGGFMQMTGKQTW